MKDDSESSVLIIAAEASSSIYAQRLLELWQSQGEKVKAFGIGSRAMEKLGFEPLGRSEDLAVVGLQEVIAHFPLIRKTFHSLVDQAAKRKPKFALLLDYPDFNLRLAKKLKALGIPVVYYISPQVWAWRTGRVKLIKQVVDHILVLFPFEEEFYRKHEMKVSFVGHPLLDELHRESFDESVRKERRQRYGVTEDEFVVGLMPGSRRSEIKHHLQVQLDTLRKLIKIHPKIRPFLLVAPSLDRDELSHQITGGDLPIQIVKDDPVKMVQLTDAILCASGTATLMVGLMEKPMVIMYRMNSVTAWLAKKLVTHTKYFGLVNLIMNERVVPELFQEQANSQDMAKELSRYISDSQYREMTQNKLKQVKQKLGERGATEKVAKILSEYLRARS